MEAYKVWATLNIKGDAHKKMEQFLALVKKTNSEVNKLLKSLKSLNGGFGGLSNTTHIVNNEINIFNTTLNQTALRMSSVTNHANRLSVAIRGLNSGAGRGGRGSSNKFGMGVAGALGLYNPYMMAGAAVGGIGVGGFKEQSSYKQRLAQFEAQGFSSSDSSAINQFVSRTNIRGVSKSDLMKAIVDAAMATGSVGQALQLAPDLAKISYGNRGVFGKSFSDSEENKMIRFAEMRGGSDISLVKHTMDLAEKIYSSTGGRMGPSQLLNFQTMANSAGYHLSDTGFLRLIPIMQELGGFRTGTGYQTMFNRLITGKGLGTASGAEGLRMGLLEKNATQKAPTLKKQYEGLLQTDLVGFVKDVWLPLMKSHGITSEIGISKETALVFDRTAARDIDVIRKNLAKSDRMLALHEQAMGTEGVFSKALNIPSGKVLELTASFHNLEKAFGEFTSPLVLKGMDVLISWLNGAASFFSSIKNAHPFVLHENGNSTMGDILHKKANLNNPPSSGNASHGDVYLDGEKVGKVILNKAGNNMQTYVQHGMSGINLVSSPIYPGTNNLGSQGI